MENLLLSAAIGDIAGEPYEFRGQKTIMLSICCFRQIHTQMTLYVPLPVQKHY